MKIIVDDSDLHGLVKIMKLYQNGLSPLWRYTITHFIRRIHDKQYFKSTELVNKTTIEIPVKYRNRIGVSKVSGTIKGAIFAGVKILYWIFKYTLR